MNFLGAVLGFLGSMLLWALAEALSELFGDATSEAVAPTWRPVWRAFLRARWPRPALLMAALGVAGVIAGFRLHERYDPGWRGVAGLLPYFVGGAVAAVAPFLWRDARRARGRDAAQASRQSPSPTRRLTSCVGGQRIDATAGADRAKKAALSGLRKSLTAREQ